MKAISYEYDSTNRSISSGDGLLLAEMVGKTEIRKPCASHPLTSIPTLTTFYHCIKNKGLSSLLKVFDEPNIID